ncbi:MAG: diacylglycerol kinase family lipid kinase [Lachnospiraceae bacterium]|nr:diacylglycerol kinase family lipid kinase [Lachnospiraceae bacterium]
MKDQKKMLFIYNPHAGKAMIRQYMVDILDKLSSTGYSVTVYATKKQGDAIEKVVRDAGEYDFLVCSGGDGTLDEVVTGMMRRKKRIPVGYIPAGTTNDFARSLSIPGNMIKAAETAVKGTPFQTDIGAFNDDTFVYIAAFGIFTDVSYETDQQMKNVLGHMAYILEGAKRVGTYPSYRFSIRANNMLIEDEFLYGMVTNSVSVGGFQNITGENVELDDGLFEVTLIKKPSNVVELNEIMVALVSGRINTHMIYCFKTPHIQFESEQSVAWTLDGEFGGEHKSVTLHNKKRALSLIVPPQANKRKI